MSHQKIGGSQNIGRSLNWLKTFLDNTLWKSPLDGASMLCETLWKHISRDGVLARLTCALIIDITWKFYATKLWNNYSLQSVMKIEFLMNMMSSVCLVVSMWKKLRYCNTILEAALLLWHSNTLNEKDLYREAIFHTDFEQSSQLFTNVLKKKVHNYSHWWVGQHEHIAVFFMCAFLGQKGNT